MLAVLGDSGFEQYKAYMKTVSARSSVDAFASALYYTETPLTAGQAEQLAQLVATNTGKTEPDASGISYRGDIDWAKISVQAKDVLNSSQLDVLQALAERDRLRQQVSALSRKLTNEAIANSNKASGNCGRWGSRKHESAEARKVIPRFPPCSWGGLTTGALAGVIRKSLCHFTTLSFLLSFLGFFPSWRASLAR